MPRLTLRVGLAALALATVAGCQPPAAVPTPAPTPTFTCTPEAGGDAYECSQAQYDEMVAKNELYAEAEAVYRKFFEEDVKTLRRGGIEDPSETLVETTHGDFLADVMGQYRSMKAERALFRDGEFVLAWIRRAPGQAKSGSVISLVTCVDATTTRLFVRGDFVRNGTAARDQFYFGDVEGHLKIVGADGQEVPSCE